MRLSKHSESSSTACKDATLSTLDGLMTPPLGGVRSLRARKKVRHELVHHPLPPASIGRGAGAHSTDLLHGPLGPMIVWTDDEDYAFHRSESVLHHEPLHLAIISPAPVGAGKKRPADLNDAALRIVAVIA